MTAPVRKKAASKTAVAKVSAAQQAADELEARAVLARRALELKNMGKSWYAIAEALGITERAAGMLVKDALAEAAALVDEGHKRTMLAMEINRLDTLQEAVWADAIGGDVKAVETALRIIQTRAKVLGLDSMPTSTVNHNTIVVAGTSEEYVAALRRVVELPAITIEED